MRVLVGYDGSPGAGVALDLVRAVDWPEGTEIRLLTVVEDAAVGASSFPTSGEARRLFDAARARAEVKLEIVAGRLAGMAPVVDRLVAFGRPSAAIDDAARSFAADLVVLGSRGDGPLAALLLGSVSGEVAERAMCPVLIARTTEIDRVVLATDGSPSSREAESVVAASPVFSKSTIEVVSVANLAFAYVGLLDHTVHDVALEAEARGIADEAALRLRAAGRDARPRVRLGDPATQVVALAQAVGAGLTVVGSRGRLGFTGLLLGSVARNVLYSSPSSVLVVRPRPV